jgi:hypothetical protein
VSDRSSARPPSAFARRRDFCVASDLQATRIHVLCLGQADPAPIDRFARDAKVSKVRILASIVLIGEHDYMQAIEMQPSCEILRRADGSALPRQRR